MNLNRIKTLILGIAVIFVSISSCARNSEVDEYIDPELTHTLQKIGEYEIPVDSMTTTNFIHYQHIQEGGKEYFSMLNNIKQEINFYDVKKRELAFKIPLIIEGPNGVGNLDGFNSGYYVHNLDSIFVLNRNRREFFLINRQSELINSFDAFRDKDVPSAVIAPFAPMIVHNDEAILLNIQNGMKYFSRNKSYRTDYATKVGLTNRDTEYFLSYPDIFTTGSWGFDLHRISWAFDLERERILVGYPLDHNIYTLDFDGRLLEKAPARIESVKNVISISKRQFKSKSGPLEYYLEQPRYGQVFFDSKRRIILRDYTTGVSVEKQKQGIIQGERVLVILDENLKKTAEVKETSLGMMVLFFNEDGLHKYIPSDDENKLKFELYDYVVINK
ncbi:DUF4221 family protein [Roseivirga misakiensis]|uniref:DUF4221 domain-containing protein n=1 Tax=Roseivirga misakiensis TaxID=1563681 RepID=A0A1E5T5V4_9BACT|nr:DUF4221 family protein [Roseivirga misakiensis]OEK06687.1 hypothetical protein BFP71_03210 [Roseivirga misakiensis]